MGQAQGLEALQRVADMRFLQWKKIAYWLRTPAFLRAYGLVKETDERLEKAILDGDLPTLKEWITQNTPLTDLSFRQLRRLAGEENVPYYSRLSKAQLLTALDKYGKRTLRQPAPQGAEPNPQDSSEAGA